MTSTKVLIDRERAVLMQTYGRQPVAFISGEGSWLTDADGKDWVMTGNSAGNFWLPPTSTVAMPYQARIVDEFGNERIKQEPVSDGDCASCHTREGAACRPLEGGCPIFGRCHTREGGCPI